MSDPIEKARTGVEILEKVMSIAGNDPNVEKAGRNLGQAALTVTATINNVLLPLAAVNYAFDRARQYFATRFQDELQEKAASIPPENIVSPKASIAGPSLQALAFSHEETELKEMFLSLITTAMDGRVAETAHPAFVEVIKQLNAYEARLLSEVLKVRGPLPMATFQRRVASETGYRELSRHCINFMTEEGPAEISNLEAIVDNWVRLGLVEAGYDRWPSSKDAFDWVESRPEYLRLKSEHETADVKVTFRKGALARTAFGHLFAQAVGLVESDRLKA